MKVLIKNKRMSIKTTTNLIGILFFIIGLIFVIFGTISAISNANFKNHAKTTEAEIIEINYQRRKSGNSRHTVIVKYNIANTEYVTQLNEFNSKMYVGKKINIYYDPNDPGNIKTDSILVYVICIPIGGIFTIVGGIFIFINLKSVMRRKNLIENGDVFTGTIFDVKMNTLLTINHRHPYKAECEVIDPYTNERYLYSSENIVNDISELIGSNVTVYVDKNNKGKYFVDINELINNVASNVHDYR